MTNTYDSESALVAVLLWVGLSVVLLLAGCSYKNTPEWQCATDAECEAEELARLCASDPEDLLDLQECA